MLLKNRAQNVYRTHGMKTERIKKKRGNKISALLFHLNFVVFIEYSKCINFELQLRVHRMKFQNFK